MSRPSYTPSGRVRRSPEVLPDGPGFSCQQEDLLYYHRYPSAHVRHALVRVRPYPRDIDIEIISAARPGPLALAQTSRRMSLPHDFREALPAVGGLLIAAAGGLTIDALRRDLISTIDDIVTASLDERGESDALEVAMSGLRSLRDTLAQTGEGSHA